MSNARLDRYTKHEITTEVMVRQLAAMICCDIADFVDADNKLLPVHEMPARARAAIEGLTFMPCPESEGGGYKVSGIQIIRRTKIMELAMKYLGMMGNDAERNREALSLRKLIEEAQSLPDRPAYIKAGQVIEVGVQAPAAPVVNAEAQAAKPKRVRPDAGPKAAPGPGMSSMPGKRKPWQPGTPGRPPAWAKRVMADQQAAREKLKAEPIPEPAAEPWMPGDGDSNL
jgi:hypothetical protein